MYEALQCVYPVIFMCMQLYLCSRQDSQSFARPYSVVLVLVSVLHVIQRWTLCMCAGWHSFEMSLMSF